MKILLISSGGDAPGMNRYIWELYSKYKKELYFAYAGFSGLINGQIFGVEEVIDKTLKDSAGTVIKTSRCPEFKQTKFFQMGLENAKKYDVVIILGGNGSEKGAKRLYDSGVNTIFVPATIDNDVDDSFYCLGFSTAVKECVYAVQNTMPSITALINSCLFEVMGREKAAICETVHFLTKSDYAVTCQKDLDFEKIKNLLLQKYITSQSASIIVRENIMPINEIEDKLNEMLGMDIVKSQVVGRTQRGGCPTVEELEMATKFAKSTIQCIKSKALGVRILADEKWEPYVKPFQ